MSKIEKALNRSRAEQGTMLVPVRGPDSTKHGLSATGMALLSERIGHPETISAMAASEASLLGPDQLAERRIIHPSRAGDPAVQVFRELRTRIVQQGKGQNGAILVTGVNPRSGSSFIAQNLGAAFAFDTGKTALLVDCNLKNPSVHHLLADPAAPGLADYLENPRLDLAKVIHPIGIPRYRVIPAGRRPENQTEHFTSLKMKQFVDSVRRRYLERFIVLDGPPMSDIADIRVLAELADYVLVVARYARVTNSQIENCLSAISENKLLGIVFNDEPRVPRVR